MNTEEIFKKYKKYHTPWVRAEKKVYRNDPCICGSGKKNKNCCGNRTKYRLK